MRKWKDLYEDLPVAAQRCFVGEGERAGALEDIKGIGFDTRSIKEGELFVALGGVKTQGAHFINEAFALGVAGVLCEAEDLCHIADSLRKKCVVVENTPFVLGHLAAAYYGHPSKRIRLVGITGTNGKTTIATLLANLLNEVGERSGLISTIEYRMGTQSLTATHTTPDALRLQCFLATMLREGCSYAMMEVSSHALAQQRVAGLQFEGAVLSNITHDHLDYHATFLNYVNTKKGLFDMLGKEAFALTNLDDANGQFVLQNTSAKQIAHFSLHHPCAYKAEILEDSPLGLLLRIDGENVQFRLCGRFNAYNILAVLGAAHLLGVDKAEALRILSGLKGIEGRYETIPNNRGIHILLDYAHTPDALACALKSVNLWRENSKVAKHYADDFGRIIVLVGCGGERDKSKRPLMGQVAARYGDMCFFTSDNPRSEDPAAILCDMKTNMAKKALSKVKCIVDRKEAIQLAIKEANQGDILLVAGKGHEQYQEIQGIKHTFSDKQIIKQLLAQKQSYN